MGVRGEAQTVKVWSLKGRERGWGVGKGRFCGTASPSLQRLRGLFSYHPLLSPHQWGAGQSPGCWKFFLHRAWFHCAIIACSFCRVLKLLQNYCSVLHAVIAHEIGGGRWPLVELSVTQFNTGRVCAASKMWGTPL